MLANILSLIIFFTASISSEPAPVFVPPGHVPSGHALASGEISEQVTGLSPDVLHLMTKLPEGNLDGVEYSPAVGQAVVKARSKEEVDRQISALQDVYQKIVGSKQLKVQPIPVPAGVDIFELNEVLSKFNQNYSQCVFQFCEDDSNAPGVVKIISNSSRQFEQSKKMIADEITALGKSVEAICFSHGRSLILKRADIVQEDVAIIVNAANERLAHAGGVAAAIDKASHGVVQHYSSQYVQQHGPVPVGGVAVTGAGGSLKAKFIIHAVGPRKSSDQYCMEMLQRVVTEALHVAEDYQVPSIAFPAISSGIFGVNKDLVAVAMTDTILNYQFRSLVPILSSIRIVIIDQPTFSSFAKHFSLRKSEVEERRTVGAGGATGPGMCM